MRDAAALSLTWLFKLGIVTAAALYPLRGELWRLAHFWDVWSVYSLANSNLDVWALTMAQGAVLAALLSWVSSPGRRYSGLVMPPPYGKARCAPARGSSAWVQACTATPTNKVLADFV